MRTVSVAEAKAHLSALLDAVESGEDIVITRRGKPVVRMTLQQPAAVDFSVFRRHRGAWRNGMRIDRQELNERGAERG